jgi:hypothetical protein
MLRIDLGGIRAFAKTAIVFFPLAMKHSSFGFALYELQTSPGDGVRSGRK